MAPPVPTSVPKVLVAGTTWQWDVTYPDTPPSEGYTVTFYFHSREGIKKHIKATTVSGQTYQFRETAVNTSPLVAGLYDWEARAVKGAEVVTVARGEVRVMPDVVAAVGGGLQPDAVQIYRALMAEKKRRTGAAVGDPAVVAMIESYSIGGRTINHLTAADLNKEIGIWGLRKDAALGRRLGVTHEVSFG